MTLMFKSGLLLGLIVMLSPLADAQALARYRDFEFGMTVDSVAKQARLDPVSARTVYKAPGLIQTIEWNQQGYFSSSAAADADSVRTMRFDFYNDQLFRIVATYGRRQIEGMTAEDLIEAISRIYGAVDRTEHSIVTSAYTPFEDRQKVIGRWENADYAYSLFQSPYGSEFGLMAISKKLESAAAIAVREAERLELLGAPQREIDRQKKEAETKRVEEEKSRSVNRPNFRP